jgi:hypothetical protein
VSEDGRVRPGMTRHSSKIAEMTLDLDPTE